MAFDEQLADRVRRALAPREGLRERRMFGGIGFMLNGNMCCGVHGEELIVRLGPEAADAALDEPHTRPFDLTGRPMTGWLWVGAAALETDADLGAWVARGAAFAYSIPAKR